MKRIPINLASEPVEAVRRARRIVGAAAIALLVVSVLHLSWLAWATTADDSEQGAADPVASVDTLRAWQQEVAELAAVADVQRARAAATAVEIANQLIAWRTIPWSAIFADLETLLPDRVRLEAVQPAIETDDVVRVSMTAAAADTGPLQGLLIALEESPRFVDVLPIREDVGQDGVRRMILVATYVRAFDPIGEERSR
jgi:Tfp pilus assembly protein PilN